MGSGRRPEEEESRLTPSLEGQPAAADEEESNFGSSLATGKLGFMSQLGGQLAQWPWTNSCPSLDSVSSPVQWEQSHLHWHWPLPEPQGYEEDKCVIDLSPLICREPVPAATMASRIGLRMQLMREQAQQEEQRERMQQQAVMHYMQQQQQQQQLGGPPTPAINTPVHFQSPPPVPGEVLKVGPALATLAPRPWS